MNFNDSDTLNVGGRHLCKIIVDVGDQNGSTRHQHLLIVTKTFRVKHQAKEKLLS